ncbi:MAG: serine hydrolase, partial [Saprospiraceae bacterium]
MRTTDRPSAIAPGVAPFASTLQAAAERHRIPTAVAVVADKDRVLLQTSYGHRDSQSGIPVDGQSIFLIASMT